MEIRLETAPVAEIEADWLIVPVAEESVLSGQFAELDAATGGSLTRLREAGDLTGKRDETLADYNASGLKAERLLFVGLGKPEKINVSRFHRSMMTAVRKVSKKKNVRPVLLFPDLEKSELSLLEAATIIAAAFKTGCVGQGVYQTEPSRFPLAAAAVAVNATGMEAALTAGIERGSILGDAVNLTRDLVNRTADEIYPHSFAERARSVSAEAGLTYRVLDEQQIKDEKMGSLLAVAVGSDRPPRLVVVEHRGGNDDAPTLALVGKGVTFDSGGLSLKTTEGMKTMKCDMAGAATVLGAMSAIARLNIPVNVTGYMGLVENMISGSSYKLGDVLNARNGVTIEVLNTDAEGRLVLADVLSYAADSGADRIIDLATLTGACVVALGEEITGAFSNDSDWCDEVLAAAKTCGEDVWAMPMHDHFAELLKSDVADCKNVGPRWGGAITAAKFLEKFVDEKPWVHLDIAGPSFASSSQASREGGATGCMVRTLVEVASRLAANG